MSEETKRKKTGLTFDGEHVGRVVEPFQFETLSGLCLDGNM